MPVELTIMADIQSLTFYNDQGRELSKSQTK